MKNIHILPTDKPSRLWVNNLLQGKLELSKEALPYNTAQHIYITCDEEIKEKDYYLDKFGIIIKRRPVKNNRLMPCDGNWVKKIILTTDQDLIADGVQAIDDEFLKWFVKNPSCEEVEVEYGDDGNGYQVIIPKEEPKMIECYFTPRKDTSSATICSNCGQEKFMHTIGSGIKVSKSVIITKEYNPFPQYIQKIDDNFLE